MNDNNTPTNTSIKANQVKGGITLLIVDGQIDFHPGRGGRPDGSLAIPNADKDASRIANLIKSTLSKSEENVEGDGNDNGNANAMKSEAVDLRGSSKSAPTTSGNNQVSRRINRIVATMDSHHKMDISHGSFWVDKDGNHPSPFTIIESKEIRDGKWMPRSDIKLPPGDDNIVDPEIFNTGSSSSTEEPLFDKDGTLNLLQYAIEYTKRLEEGGKFKLCIWPEHCLMGSMGHCIEPEIQDALNQWADHNGSLVEYILKGQSILTEMYSALKAEVELSESTKFNTALLESLRQSDYILICGEALSHCVNHTARDMIDNMKGEEYKIIILQDCASSVTGFDAAGQEFLNYMEEKGATICPDVNAAFDEIDRIEVTRKRRKLLPCCST